MKVSDMAIVLVAALVVLATAAPAGAFFGPFGGCGLGGFGGCGLGGFGGCGTGFGTSFQSSFCAQSSFSTTGVAGFGFPFGFGGLCSPFGFGGCGLGGFGLGGCGLGGFGFC